MNRGRSLVWALLCQGMLNDSDLEYWADAYQPQHAVPADYTALLWRVRHHAHTCT